MDEPRRASAPVLGIADRIHVADHGRRAEAQGGQPVGAACAANPIPVIVPCHRVLSAEGLGGFSGGTGVETKIALLRHEGGYPFLI